MASVTLVFPSSMMESHAFTRLAKARGDRVVAASSVKADETAKFYDQWVYLPSIYDPNFERDFCKLIALEQITHFYTAHMVVFLAVKALVEKESLSLVVCQSPIEALQGHYRDVFGHVMAATPFVEAISGRRPKFSLMSSLFHFGEQIFGQTSEAKIAAMAAIFADAPKGDVIEIGSAWGRSAFILATLATHYDIGNVLCVDPWEEEIAQHESDPAGLTAANQILDWDLTFQIFLTHLAPFGGKRLNFMRQTSECAILNYLEGSTQTTDEFGATAYSRLASVIHIDGNHGFDCIDTDCRLWRPMLLPGGWLIIDDYVWEHGTGPRLVGDALLARESNNILNAFTSGNALFIKFRDAVHSIAQEQ